MFRLSYQRLYTIFKNSIRTGNYIRCYKYTIFCSTNLFSNQSNPIFKLEIKQRKSDTMITEAKEYGKQHCTGEPYNFLFIYINYLSVVLATSFALY